MNNKDNVIYLARVQQDCIRKLVSERDEILSAQHKRQLEIIKAKNKANLMMIFLMALSTAFVGTLVALIWMTFAYAIR